jgi:hypothetical protein
VGVGGPPSYLVGGAPFSKLNFGFAQYTTSKGHIQNFRDYEIAAARAAGLGAVFSLDVLNGNNGGTMTASQVSFWGRVLACEGYTAGVLLWKYDAALFADSAMQEAIRAIARVANQGVVFDRACIRRLD